MTGKIDIWNFDKCSDKIIDFWKFDKFSDKIIDIWKFDKCSDKILKFFERKCTLNIRSSKRAKRGNYEQINIEEPGEHASH